MTIGQDTDAARVVARLYDALSMADLDAAIACCSPQVRIWHNFDCQALTLDQAVAGWRAFCSAFSERYVRDVRCVPIPGGVLQRHLQVVRSNDGVRLTWPICIIVNVRDHQITRLDEYIDRAGSFSGELTQTPGLD